MKTCPVCGSSLFDDMQTCYGCLYQYGETEESTSWEVSQSLVPWEIPHSSAGSVAELSVPIVLTGQEEEQANIVGDEKRRDVFCEDISMAGWGIRLEGSGAQSPGFTLTIHIEPLP